MKIPALLLGRILFSMPFLAFGLMHFTGTDQMSGSVPSWLPGGVFWIYLTGVTELGAVASILTGKYTKTVAQLLALQLLVYVCAIHIPGLLSASNEVMKQMFMMNVLKDLGLAGGALLISHIYADRP